MGQELIPFIKQVISVHKKKGGRINARFTRTPRGYMRIQAIVKVFGVIQTRHIDVPQNFRV